MQTPNRCLFAVAIVLCATAMATAQTPVPHFIYRDAGKMTLLEIATGKKTVIETMTSDKFVADIHRRSGAMLYSEQVNTASNSWKMMYRKSMWSPYQDLPFPGAQYNGAISPDGKRIAFTSSENKSVLNGAVRLYTIATGAAETVVPASVQVHGVDWLPDGKGIVYTTSEGTSTKTSFYRLVFGQSAQLIVTLNNPCGAGILSPDGTRLAFMGNVGGSWKINFLTIATGALTQGPNYYHGGLDWDADGKNIVYGTADGLRLWNTATLTNSALVSGQAPDAPNYFPVYPDEKAPETAATIAPTAPASGWHTAASVTIGLKATDPTPGSGVKEVRHTVNMGSEKATAGEIASTVIADEGIHSVAYWSIDHKGNVEATKTTTVKIDRTKPVPAASVAAGILTLAATDNLSGVATQSYKVDGGAWTAYTGPVTLPATAMVVRHKAVDNAGNESAEATLLAGPVLKTITATPSPAYAGSAVTIKVDILAPAPDGGILVALASSDATLLPLATSLTIPAGATSATVSATLGAVAAETVVNVTATVGDNLLAAGIPVLVPAPRTLVANPSVVAGGSNVTFTLTLASKAPAGGQVVNLASLSTAALTVPDTVTVPAGALTATFTGTAATVSVDTAALVVARIGEEIAACSVVVRRITVASAVLTPNSVVGGQSSILKITLNRAAPTGGTTVNLFASGLPVKMPASGKVAAGTTSLSVIVETTSVATTGTALIRAQIPGSVARTSLVVTPARIASVTLSPTSAKGRASVTGKVNLTGPAPEGGLSVRLASSKTDVATVDATVVVPAGASSATFAIATKAVSANTTVVIGASRNLDTKTATLTVTP